MPPAAGRGPGRAGRPRAERGAPVRGHRRAGRFKGALRVWGRRRRRGRAGLRAGAPRRGARQGGRARVFAGDGRPPRAAPPERLHALIVRGAGGPPRRAPGFGGARRGRAAAVLHRPRARRGAARPDDAHAGRALRRPRRRGDLPAGRVRRGQVGVGIGGRRRGVHGARDAAPPRGRGGVPRRGAGATGARAAAEAGLRGARHEDLLAAAATGRVPAAAAAGFLFVTGGGL